MADKTCEGLTFKECNDDYDQLMKTHQQMVLSNVNKAAAIIEAPEKFGLDHFSLQKIITNEYAKHRVIEGYPKLVTLDQAIEDILCMSDRGQVEAILQAVETISPPREYATRAFSETLHGMSSMLMTEACRRGNLRQLKYECFKHDEGFVINGRTAYHRFLDEKNYDAFVFLDGLCVSDCNMNVKRTNLTCAVEKDLGYNVFTTCEYDQGYLFPIDDVKVDAEAYGPVKMTLLGSYYPRLPEFMTGCFLKKAGECKTNGDFTCAAVRWHAGPTYIPCIRLKYTQTYGEGVYHVSEFYADALLGFRKMIESLNVRQANNL